MPEKEKGKERTKKELDETHKAGFLIKQTNQENKQEKEENKQERKKMGCVGSKTPYTGTKEEQSQSKKIDTVLRKERRDLNREIKLLLLGL